MNPVSRVARGFFSPFEGAQVLFASKKNFSFAVIPFVIGLCFVVIGFFAASRYFEPMVQEWIKSLEYLKNWTLIQSIVSFFILTISWILVSIMNFIVGYIAIMLLGGPFYALMVENIFRQTKPSKKIQGSWKLMINMFVMALGKILLFLIVGAVCFILAFFPVINIFAGFAVVMLVSFDCADYAFETDFLSLKQRFGFLRQHFFEFSGLTFAIMLTGFLPGSFFLLLPVFISGATKMYIQLSEKPV